MKHSNKVTLDIGSLNQNWRWFFGWGLGLIILGILAISFATFTTLLSIVLLGALILMSGLFVLIDSLRFWRGKRGFFIHLLMGILYTIVGLLFIFSPVVGSVTITLMLAILFIIVGFFRSLNAISLKLPMWGWSLASGLITLLLGILILAEWPASSLFIIGIFIGVDLIIFGWATVMVSLFARKG